MSNHTEENVEKLTRDIVDGWDMDDLVNYAITNMKSLFLVILIMFTTVACAHHDGFFHYSETRSYSHGHSTHGRHSHRPCINPRERAYSEYRTVIECDDPKPLGLIKVEQKTRHHSYDDYYERQFYESKGYCLVEQGRRLYSNVYEIRWYRRPFC